MGYFQFASVAVAITVAAIAPAIVGKTTNAASPNAVSAELGSDPASLRALVVKLAKLESSSRDSAASYPHFQSEVAIRGEAAPPSAVAAAEVRPQSPDAPTLGDIPSDDARIGDVKTADVKTGGANAPQANADNASYRADESAETLAETSQAEAGADNADDASLRDKIAAADLTSVPATGATGGGVDAVSAKTEQKQPEQSVADVTTATTAAAETAPPDATGANLPNYKLAAAEIGSESFGGQSLTALPAEAAAAETAKAEQASPEIERTATLSPPAQDVGSASQARTEARVDLSSEPPKAAVSSVLSVAPASDDQAGRGAAKNEQTEKVRQAKLEENIPSLQDNLTPALAPNQELSYLAYYPYAEILPNETPAQMALDKLKGISVGAPIEEIKRAARAFGLDFNFMKAVAKVESDFDPRQRTGSYIGLFQLSHYEFKKYGSGEITNSRDNAVAAAYKFITEATLFELDTHRNPTYSDLYLIHQQGWQGAAEHVAHPDRIAWKSMCATDEGKEKGEKWCKRAVWQNTLPAIKHVWKSVEKMTSGAFVAMWRQRIDRLYARYATRTEK